jgi:hypothetical protein
MRPGHPIFQAKEVGLNEELILVCLFFKLSDKQIADLGKQNNTTKMMVVKIGTMDFVFLE